MHPVVISERIDKGLRDSGWKTEVLPDSGLVVLTSWPQDREGKPLTIEGKPLFPKVPKLRGEVRVLKLGKIDKRERYFARARIFDYEGAELFKGKISYHDRASLSRYIFANIHLRLQGVENNSRFVRR